MTLLLLRRRRWRRRVEHRVDGERVPNRGTCDTTLCNEAARWHFSLVLHPPCKRALTNLSCAMAALLVGCARPAGAQIRGVAPDQLSAARVAVFGGNVIVGALTATTHALLVHKDPFKAFALGALGGAVHVTGKMVGTGRGIPNGLAGVAIASAGTAIVANAGDGRSLFDELFIPVGSLRVRWQPGTTRLRLGINVFETAVIVRNLLRPGLEVDWDRSAATGALVFVTERFIESGGKIVAGVTVPPIVVITTSDPDLDAILRHEFVHVAQSQFLDETWGRPIDEYLRRHVPFLRSVPRWIEPGLATPVIWGLNDAVFAKSSPARRLGESEARILARR